MFDKKKYDTEYRAKHREQYKVYFYNRYHENAESEKTRQTKWRKDNAEKIKKDKKAWSEANRDKRRASNSRYAKAHPERINAKTSRRRAIQALAEGSYTGDEFVSLCQKFRNVCLCCLQVKPLTADHVVPLSKGGCNSIDNIQPLCGECNSKKNTKIVDYRVSFITNTLPIEEGCVNT